MEAQITVYRRKDDTFGWSIADVDEPVKYAKTHYESESEALDGLGFEMLISFV